MDCEEYENAILVALGYNGLNDVVRSWAALEADDNRRFATIKCPKNYGLDAEDYNQWPYHQLQFVWMIGVLLFGDYGTSPRFGWIEKIDAWRAWVRRITEEAEGGEEDGPESDGGSDVLGAL